MRCFLGLRVNKEQAKEAHHKAISALKMRGVKGSFVPLENIHLTYIFFGERTQEEINDIIHILDSKEDVKNFPSRVKINRISSFNYRVVFFNIEDQEGVEEHRNAMYDILRSSIKINEDHKFHAHITIARVKYGFNSHILDKLNQSFTSFTLDVEALCLYESILSPYGVKYREIKCW